VGDVTSKVDLEQITKRISSEVGHINLLVANAGTTGPMFGDRISICGPDQSPLSDVQKDLWNIDQDAFLNTFKTNIGGPFWSIVAFLPLLDAGNRKGNVVQSSHVVATGSEAAYDRIPIPHYTYSASKAGLTHMMKQFATTFVKYKIRFNVIAPGRKSLCLFTFTTGLMTDDT
jgi:NAD(P)-dependent dehydrogenase (short-subunit alcohol dehydrogenase family)